MYVLATPVALCWFQTNLPLAALPLDHRLLFQSCSSQRQRRFGFSPSGNRYELNRIQLSVIYRDGQSGKVIDLLAWRCLPLGHPSAASDACAVELISSSKRQCGKRQVSLKPALIMLVFITVTRLMMTLLWQHFWCCQLISTWVFFLSIWILSKLWEKKKRYCPLSISVIVWKLI